MSKDKNSQSTFFFFFELNKNINQTIQRDRLPKLLADKRKYYFITRKVFCPLLVFSLKKEKREFL